MFGLAARVKFEVAGEGAAECGLLDYDVQARGGRRWIGWRGTEGGAGD